MKNLTAQEIRNRFLQFFKERQHELVESGPLVPADDPSLLFTNAGMVQFKKLFLGEEKRSYARAATCQKCLRVSGKHNDLENVGRTARHHTFFEMLGNFSFGNYFKEKAIAWAWEFVTRELGLPPEKLWVTVFRDDDEAFEIWRRVAGLPEERIVRMGEKDNFWTMGDTGPCGPCSEIYIDQGEGMSCGPDCGIGKCDCDRFLEIWNLVFTQFDQSGDGSRTPLAAPNIDTGMGLERIAAVCQGKQSNFDCDLFQSIIQYAAGLASVTYSFSEPDTNDIDTALRVIADHARAAAFLIAEGVLPSNESRGYVLRRLIRRALRFSRLIGVQEPFLHKVAVKVAEVMGEAYPELLRHSEFIDKAVHEEEKRFALTLDNGLAMLESELGRLRGEGKAHISGEFCFRLYDTYGFPLDIVKDVAEKRGFTVDVADFEAHMADQRKRARENQKKSGLFGHGNADELLAACGELARKGLKNKFVGYSTLSCKSEILVLLDGGGAPVEELGEGASGYVITATTPFYGESGGQVGDQGLIVGPAGQGRIRGAIKPDPDLIVQEVEVKAGELHKGDAADLTVDGDRRKSIARNHTCTHLLHAALRRTLGEHVKQAGSLVDAARLRFDFSHFSALTVEELAAVERDVNRAILADLPVITSQMAREEAMASGAMALFSEKYGDTVRVLSIGREGCPPESVELCGGTHLERTGEAGSFYIISESAVAAGVRRIEAVTGWNAYDFAIGQRSRERQVAEILKTRPEQLQEKARQLQDEVKKLRKAAGGGTARPAASQLAAKARKVGEVTLIGEVLDGVGINGLRQLIDDLRGQFPDSAVICLAGIDGGKISIILYVSHNLHKRFTAPELVRIVSAPCGGSGGGRPDVAQAGGSNPAGIAEGLAALGRALL